MPEYKLYDVSVSTLTPLHIGSGDDLLHQYDYAIHNGKTWRINELTLLDAQNVDDPALADQLARTKPEQLLQPQDYREGSDYFRYVINGTPRSKAEGAQLREQIKNHADLPYLPGTTLKGAIRTSLAWHAWGLRQLTPQVSELGPQPKFAAQKYEHKLIGRNPNHDLLRAVQVSDSIPVNADRLFVANARVLHRNGALASPIEMEALLPDTGFNLTIKLDFMLFSEWAQQRDLQLTGRGWLAKLPQIMQAHAQTRIDQELRWLKESRETTALLQFYQQLHEAQLSSNQFLVQIGWGTGWEDKTLGSRLQSDGNFMEEIIRKYRLARGRRQHGDRFPKSRRVTVRFVKDRNGQSKESPASPFGWCLVKMKERK